MMSDASSGRRTVGFSPYRTPAYNNNAITGQGLARSTYWLSLLACVLSALLLAACEGAGGSGGGGTSNPPTNGGNNPPPGGERYNIVVIYTDDQRWDTAGADVMAEMNSRLQSHGAVRFNNAYVSTPLCCPSRASIYSGGLYAHRTGVLANDAPNGGVDQFVDVNSMGKALHDIGYKTMFAGKYFSSYASASYGHGSPYIPPGWTQFVGRSSYTTDPQGWTNFNYTTGSSESGASTGAKARVEQYTVNYERDRIKEFIDQQQADEPFYIFMSTTAPHPPAQPMTDDIGSRSGFNYSVPSQNETDLSDKPDWVSNWPSSNEGQNPDNSMDFARRQLETLQSVDRAIGVIIDRLSAKGLLDNTMFVFTSDNGFLWGEHGLWGKGAAYEESVRVPLIIFTPNTVTLREENSLVSANLDLGATLLDYAGIGSDTINSDGFTLRPLLENSGAWPRTELFMESFGPQLNLFGMWTGVVQYANGERWKYIQQGDGTEELYDLTNDPYEMESLHTDPAFAGKKSELQAKAEAQRPLVITTYRNQIKQATVGVPYTMEITAAGGIAPFDYEWSVFPAKPLPGEFTLTQDPGDPSKAIISGTPSTARCLWPFGITVEDVQDSSSTAMETEHGRGQRYTYDSYFLTVKNADNTSPCP